MRDVQVDVRAAGAHEVEKVRALSKHSPSGNDRSYQSGGDGRGLLIGEPRPQDFADSAPEARQSTSAEPTCELKVVHDGHDFSLGALASSSVRHIQRERLLGERMEARASCFL